MIIAVPRLYLLGVYCCLVQAQTPLDRAVLASRAQSFAESLPNLVCTETLVQKELRHSTRLRIRRDDQVLVAPPPKIQEREIVSELGYVLDGREQPTWREVRKVMRVDAKLVASREKARERLVFGLRSNRDRDRMRMMEEFARYGLDTTATDYGLTLLIFLPSEIAKFEFKGEKEEVVNGEALDVYLFRRTDREAAVTVFDNKRAEHAPLQGRVWIQRATGTPLRIQLLAVTRVDDAPILDEGVVQYGPSRFGSLVATSVHFQRSSQGKLLAEAEYRYSDHQKFGAEAELKFESDPEKEKP